MTISQIDERETDLAMAALWKQHRSNSLERIETVEETVATIIRGTATTERLEPGISAAHKLAGSLGTFGYEEGSRIALAVETLLRDHGTDGRELAEAVARLRAAVEDTPMPTDDEPYDAADPPSDDATRAEPAGHRAGGHIDVVLISTDDELAARITAASVSIGLSCNHVTADAVDLDPSLLGGRRDRGDDATPAPLVLIDATGFADHANDLIELIERVPADHPVAVLTDTTDLDQRLQLIKAGVVATIPRTQAPRNTVDYLLGIIRVRRHDPWQIHVLGPTPELTRLLEGAFGQDGAEIIGHPDSAALWPSLVDGRADLIIVAETDGGLSTADLCRIIRADPDLHRIPIVVHGSDGPLAIAEALEAGADDVVTTETPSAEIQGRFQRMVARTVADHSGSGIDRTTGLEDRNSAERSLDRLLGLATRRSEPLAMVRLRFDHLDAVIDEYGHVVGDLLMRRTADAIRSVVRGTDVVARWSANEIVIGFVAAGRAAASNRITPLLGQLADQEVIAPSGRPVGCRFRWHMAIAPEDGTTVASLDRIGLNALGDDAPPAALDELSVVRNNVDVVVVEDDDSVADVIAYALGLRGYTSARYSDGAEAAAALSGNEVYGRVVLLDVGLPSLDGFGVLDRLGTTGVVDRAHVIMLTARSNESERLRALDLGATEHMGKPFSIPVLLSRLDQILLGTAQ